MKRKAIIIDDEPFIRDDLREMLADHRDIEVVGEAGTIADAKKLMASRRFDVVFLDIQLRGGSGFDLVPLIDISADIIFITAHDEFAVRAFEINALDYLLKPVTRERLAESLWRLLHKEEKQPATTESQLSFESTDRVFIKTESGQLFVSLDSIAAIHSIGGNYVAVYLGNKEKLLTRKTLKDWETLLPKSLFFRIHRSTIINIDFVEQIGYEKDGSSLVHLWGLKETFAVSRRMLSRLKNAL